MRTFIHSSGDEKKFYNIERKGKRYTATSGKLFTAGRKRTTEATDANAAKEAVERLVRKKLAEGYVETTPPTVPALQQALENALVEDPDDLAAHMAYADYLMEQGDPRGELIQVQMELEKLPRKSKKKDTLQQREAALFQGHLRPWLGEVVASRDGPRRPGHGMGIGAEGVPDPCRGSPQNGPGLQCPRDGTHR